MYQLGVTFFFMYGYQLFSSMNSTKDSSIITIEGWAYTTSTLLPMQELSAEEGGGLVIIRRTRYHCVENLSTGLCLYDNAHNTGKVWGLLYDYTN